MGLTRLSSPLVYFSILVVAICGIIYELIIGAVSSYLWGDSVYYFSVTIGLYMSAMGLGAFLSRFLKSALFDWFVGSEILVGLIGGSSSLLLFWAYTSTDAYEYAFVLITVLIGVFVGVEIPLLIRILEAQESLRLNVANVLTYDYIGGLVGALLFPLLLLPKLGLLRTAMLLGILNLLVALLNFIHHRKLLKNLYPMLVLSGLICFWLGYCFWHAPQLQYALEQRLYRDNVVLARQTPYQNLTLTQWHKDIRLFINGGLQFSSLDEYRYHESLVHVPMAAVPQAKRVLILGGGDGLAVRELLKYKQAQITLVDIDPVMTEVFRSEPLLTQLNQNSLNDERVTILHQDAFKFVEQDTQFYDVVLIDLPDPSNTALSKLYSRGFYELVKRRLSLQGVLVTQSTSPFFAPQAYWCIHNTLQSADMNVFPYQVEVPSFGNWGFQMATRRELDISSLKVPGHLDLKYISTKLIPSLFVLPLDIKQHQNAEINTMMKPVILKYYEQGWDRIR